MKELDIQREQATLTLSFDEVYALVQCITETHDRLSDGDLQAIVGLSKEQLYNFGEAFNTLKIKMRNINQGA
jgi:hypothetical protein